ncbi:MAG: glycosyltransferase family 2 protein [Bacteroidales bacterium]|nr:glycosyltransferase family 2 protein [Bacteroidales bacterium]MDD4216194.1 glycosyltransferase family 2 protein [Bacteroidales bacterium]MDY0141534.1 glycosyltransferase family 2 protein [Bacteroidales bacterium]
MTKSLSIIVSVYNEQDGLLQFWESISKSLLELKEYRLRLIFVNDGSKDDSSEILKKISNESKNGNILVEVIEFSRNFGHEAAMIAGIDHTDDDILICMDADLQHPPEYIAQMLEQYQKGSEIVLMNRVKRHDKIGFSSFSSKVFYKLINWLSENNFENNASDFFLISQDVANVLKSNYRERNRFLRGFIQVIGFRINTLEFEAPARFAGISNYNFKSLFKLGFTAIFAFSNKPLKISLFCSIAFLLFSFVFIVFTLIVYFFYDTPPSGYTTMVILQALGFTVISFMITILSSYFGRSLFEIRDRPIYIIKNIKK